MHPAQYLRRKDAAAYLKAKYGFCSTGTLAKLATLGGGPEFQYLGNLPVYVEEKLDAWARAKLSRPIRSTSDRAAGMRTVEPTSA
jgi:hypothetical protein